MISIIIRTKNEGHWLARCLTSVSMQDYPEYEVILIDNASEDDSQAVGERFGCRILEITDDEYSHGRALNLGIEHAQGEFVAILSGHCIPVHDHWLSALAAHFGDPKVVGVYGRQVPLPDFGSVRQTRSLDNIRNREARSENGLFLP